MLSLFRRTRAGRAGGDRLVELGGSAVVSVLGATYLAVAL
jgi:hypothetical protein